MASATTQGQRLRLDGQTALQDLLAPRCRHDERLGRALLLQLLAGTAFHVEGMPGQIRGNMHILLVSREWTIDAPYIARHAGRVDPMRTLLYESDKFDEDTLAIRRSEGWRFRRRVRGGRVAERLIVEGGVSPACLEYIGDRDDHEWIRTLLSGLEHSPEDPRYGTTMGSTRASILAYTRTVKLVNRPAHFASALTDGDMAFGFLREFDLVLPVAPVEVPPESGPLVEWGEDELASEDLRAWLGERKRLPAATITLGLKERLEKGLARIVRRWKKHGGIRARRVFGPRVEHALLRLTAASARSEGRTEATAADVDTALRLMGWSWQTLAHLREND